MKKVIVSTVICLAMTVCYGQVPVVGQTVSFGTFAGTGGSQNSIFGYGAAFGLLGDANTIIGYNAGNGMTTATQNTFIGYKAGYSNAAAIQNHFVGYQSGYSNTIGYLNHFEGHNSGYSNLTGSENQFVGLGTGYMNSSGNGNLFIGYIAGRENTTASFNHFIGNRAGWKNTTGSSNHFTGYQAGYNNISGSNNYYSGFRAGFSNVAGSGNVFIGNNAGYYETGSNKLYIDNSETSSPLIFGDFGSRLAVVNGKFGIGTTPSTQLDIYETGGESGTNSAMRIRNGNSQNYFGNNQILFSYNGSTGFSHAVKTRHNSGSAFGNAIDFYLWKPGDEVGTVGSNLTMSLNGGNVGIGVAAPFAKLQVLNAYCDGNTWYNVSDKNMKENFLRIKTSESVLDKLMELPIQYWNYKGDKGNRHLGPTAQDFYHVFGLGNNEKAISTIDESGVALAAIQELATETRELKKLVEEQQQLISSLMQSRTESIGAPETGLKLYQNQPNPFQRDTKITMEIPREINKADLYIYDLSGKIAGQQNVPGRGVTTITIEGGSLNSGMYLYVLIGDGKATEAKRMILTD